MMIRSFYPCPSCARLFLMDRWYVPVCFSVVASDRSSVLHFAFRGILSRGRRNTYRASPGHWIGAIP